MIEKEILQYEKDLEGAKQGKNPYPLELGYRLDYLPVSKS